MIFVFTLFMLFKRVSRKKKFRKLRIKMVDDYLLTLEVVENLWLQNF